MAQRFWVTISISVRLPAQDLRCEFASKSLWRVDLTSVRLYNLEGYGDLQFSGHP
jgi:hypothetical protein